MSQPLGSPLYMAPEIVMGSNYSEKVDVWAFGMTLYLLVTGTDPFDLKSVKSIYHNIVFESLRYDEPCWAQYSENMQNCIKKCLDYDQYARPTIAELLRADPWITDTKSLQKSDDSRSHPTRSFTESPSFSLRSKQSSHQFTDTNNSS